MILIGITGKARSGKDTIADYLLQHKWFETISFANPVKRGIQAAFNLPADKLNEDKEQIIPELGYSKRQLYQLFGTEFGRNILGEDIWVKSAQLTLNKIVERSHKQPGIFIDVPGVVISDVRFDNEAEFVKKNNGIIVEVRRESATAVNDHVSEAGINPMLIDYVIENNGTIQQLNDRINEILENEIGASYARTSQKIT